MKKENNQQAGVIEKKRSKLLMFGIAAVLILALTGTIVGTTLAKYITTKSGNDTAQVAKFGVTINFNTGADEGFKSEYTAGEGKIIVKSDAANMLAPGVSGKHVFSISGNPEVAVKFSATLTVNAYSGWEVGTAEPKEAYDPVVFSLKKAGAVDPLKTGTIKEIEAFMNAEETKLEDTYYVGDDLTGSTYTLEWAWAFSSSAENDEKDTQLGEAAHNGTPAKIDFTIAVTVEQVAA